MGRMMIQSDDACRWWVAENVSRMAMAAEEKKDG
jgi:hypothetical protein